MKTIIFTMFSLYKEANMNKLSLESRLKAEVVSFSGKVCIYANDFKGNVIVTPII